MKFGIYVSLVFSIILISCTNDKKEISTENGKITGLIKLDSAILLFSQQTNKEDSVNVFKVVVSRRSSFTRINVIPQKFIQVEDVPAEIEERNNFYFLIYDGREMLMPVSNSVRSRFSELVKDFPKIQSKLYDPAILQYDIFSKDSIVQNMPAINPYDFTNIPDTINIPFGPTSK